MASDGSVASLRLVGGHPSLDFANTVVSRHGRWGPDRLACYGDLLDWAVRVGLCAEAEAARLRRAAAADPATADRALAAARRLRDEAIHPVFAAVAAGRVPPAAALGALEEAARRAQAQRRLTRGPDGRYAWTWEPGGGGFDAPALRLAHAAAELLTTGPLGRIRECPGRNCGWLFLDTSRNGQRRWCSEAECGTPARVARHRAARRQARGAARQDPAA